MFLKRLELQGFKSFADKTVLEYKPGITTVIGPNGSGKSNIADAIRWVLGEQSMKSLRGSKSEDIIFAGTQSRKALGFAEASLIFDNQDGSLPVEYNEVVVTRKLYRSGETGYYINKVPCRLKDIVELFMDTGIGKDGYSIIGQGRIDEILSNKSEDRRHIFEEAAGIVKYRVRKEESEKKLEQTRLNLLRINDILSEIEGQIDPLKMQAEKAKKYLSLREELKNIEVGLFVYNINNYKEKLEELKNSFSVLTSQKEEEDGKLSSLQEEKEAVTAKIDELIKEIEDTQNLGFESKTKIEQINSDINIAKEKISNNHLNEERYNKEIEETNQRIEDLGKEKENKASKKDNLSVNKERYEKELNEKEEELKLLTEKLSAKELEIEEDKRKVQTNTDEKYERLNELNTYDVNFENLDKRKKTLNEEIKTIISELDSQRLSGQEIKQKFLNLDNSRNKLLKELEKVNLEKIEVDNKLRDFDIKINQYNDNYRMKDSRLRFLQETEKEKDGYVKSVKSLLEACEKGSCSSKGVCGVLANLISVPKEYETAIEMTLGNSIQNIVTEKEEDAKKLINYLKINNLGRASFLPISSVKGKYIDKFKKVDGVIGVASDLIKFDKKYEQIVLNLLGRTVITKDMDSAIQLAKQNNYSFKIVTLEGDIIHPSGSMTGGSVAQKTVNILGRGREIQETEKELVKIKKEVEKLETEKNKLIEGTSESITKAEELERKLQEMEITYATERQKVENIDEGVAKLEASLNKDRKEIENIEKEKEEIIASKNGVKQLIENLEKEINELNNKIKEFTDLNKEDQEYINNLNTDITDLKISVTSFEESSASIDELIERINSEIESSKQNIENKKFEIAGLIEENQKLSDSILEYNAEIEKIKNDVENSSSKIEELRKQKDDATAKQNKINSDIEGQFDVINDLKEQIIRLENKQAKQEQDITDLINKLWEEYEITPNNAEGYERPSNIAQAQKHTGELRNQIKDLGSVNIDAIEEYKKMQERYDFMNEQRYDLETSMAKLRTVISEMMTTMKEQFAEKFKLINQNFNEVFNELFGGGKAELILEDAENILECGIDIRVQPPGKKLQNMMLLSGGEKALTAIAILFAILKINPSPFCILDEIEAALDDVNVNRFAIYLKKFSKDTQFLVITHRKGTMEIADTVYGVTMEEKGISKLLSMNLN